MPTGIIATTAWLFLSALGLNLHHLVQGGDELLVGVLEGWPKGEREGPKRPPMGGTALDESLPTSKYDQYIWDDAGVRDHGALRLPGSFDGAHLQHVGVLL